MLALLGPLISIVTSLFGGVTGGVLSVLDDFPPGGVPEWLNGSVLKTVGPRERIRGFESHPLLQR